MYGFKNQKELVHPCPKMFNINITTKQKRKRGELYNKVPNYLC